jgi:N-acetylmuramoyl-L-alanine amidase
VLRHRPAILAARLRFAVACALLGAWVFTAGLGSQTQANTYTIYTREGRRALPFRTAGGVDLVPLETLTSVFKITMAEDSLVGGLTLRGPGQTILLIPGQSFASIGPGRIVSLPAPIQRDRGGWEVPLDFIRQALGPALGLPVEVRRERRVILVGDVRLPRITARIETAGSNRRVLLDVQPPAPHTVTRAGNRLIVRFDAVALDFTPATGLPQDFVSAIRPEGTSIVLTLGPSATSFRVDGSTPSRVAIELVAPPPPPPPPPPPDAARPGGPGGPGPIPPPPPVIDVTPPGSLRSVVIDPGHGGEDVGARGPGDLVEKEFVLRLARRLKGAIESRIGLRVILTRDGDEDVPLDRRASIANNNKADLFISLHANAAVRPGVSGAQVLSVRAQDYQEQTASLENAPLPVPIVGGGTRTIDVVPWDVAQLPFVNRSASVAAILERHLAAQGVPLFDGPSAPMPVRPLVGANMPAVMIEAGFLTNPQDAQALGQAERAQKIVDAVLLMLNDIRRGIPLAPASPTAAAAASPEPRPRP